jgi:hypothetical protein
VAALVGKQLEAETQQLQADGTQHRGADTR